MRRKLDGDGAAERPEPQVGTDHEHPDEHHEGERHGEPHLARGEALLVLHRLVGRDRQGLDADRQRLAQGDHAAEPGLGQDRVALGDRVDVVRLDVDRMVGTAHGHGPVVAAAHHHALEERLASVVVVGPVGHGLDRC